MRARWKQYWDSLAVREQHLLMWGGAVALVLLLLAVQLPLQAKLHTLQARIASHHADAAWLQANATQLSALSPASPASSSSDSLLVRVDRSARDAGLGAALVGSQPAGDGALRVQLQAVRFNALISWLAAVAEQQGIRVDTATVDAAAEAGMVNATLVLRAQ